MKKKLLWYGGFFIVLMAAFYFFLFAGTDYYKAKLPVLSYVQDFTFTDQDGKPFSKRNVDGKVYVTEYFFTTCKGICPKMNENMKIVYEKYKSEPDFAIISHTSMPETDSVPLMKAFSKTMGADSLKWHFVTGSKDSLYKMARESYLLDNEKNNSMNINDQFIHTQFFAVIDKEGRVRGVYDGLKKDEVDKLSKDIKDLLREKKTPATFNNSTFRNSPN
jgi:protein SCO1/2